MILVGIICLLIGACIGIFIGAMAGTANEADKQDERLWMCKICREGER